MLQYRSGMQSIQFRAIYASANAYASTRIQQRLAYIPTRTRSLLWPPACIGATLLLSTSQLPNT